MKKKLIYMFLIFILFIVFIDVIKAEDDKIASCVYETDNVINGDSPSKFIVNVDKNYQIEYEFLAYTEKWKECANPGTREYESNGCSQIYFGVDTDFQYGDYITDTVFDCKNIPKIYHTSELDIAHMSVDYKFYKTNSSKLKSEYVLNEELSKVNLQNPSESDEENGWLYTCHFGPTILRFNKENYELINGHDVFEDINELLNNNNYSCPFKYCFWDTGVESVVRGEFLYDDRDPAFGPETCYYSSVYSDAKYTCGGILSLMQEFDKHNENYASSGSISDFSSLKKSKENIRTFCAGVLSNLDYGDSTNCVKECMEVVKVIQKDENLTPGQCGFSGKLILWIANIVKWIKYIVPVIVIVMGILDFIKALSSEKEDEMKKAQGHFIKRLIAAALIFITPFIIEFILDKMGFAANGCGIIDL